MMLRDTHPLLRIEPNAVVECLGLDRSVIGDERFEEEFRLRETVLDRLCGGPWDAEGLYDQHGQRIGRRFVFNSAADAERFAAALPTTITV